MPSTTTRRRFLAGLATTCGVAGAGTAMTGPATAAEEPPHARDQRPELGATVREAIDRAMGEYDADGATVAVVADGEAVLTEGFGHAYRNPEAPVESDRTLFRVGSVSKVIPFVAAMGLVDAGEIDPHGPVAERLESVSVPDADAYDAPVTLAHLATHTAGFEQRFPGQVAVDPEAIRPLPEALRANDPARVQPPGDRPLYTNYNAGLAGQLVADVLGTDFASAADRLVFDPLGMDESTFEPLPTGLVGGRTDAAAEVGWYSEMSPASGMSATAADMAKLLRALAGDGAAGDGRILSPEAVAELHRQWHTPHERLAGAAFGMERQRRDGTLVVGHHGGVPDFSTDLRILPEGGLGLFVSAHGAEADEVQAAATDAFLRHAAPVSEPEATRGRRPTRADSLTGRYRSRLVTDTESFEKALYGITRPATSVRIAGDGTLLTERAGTVHRWVETDPLVFRRADGADTLVVETTERGERYLFFASDPRSPLESVPWYAQGRFHGPLGLLSGVLSLSGAIGWPLAAGRRRYRDEGSPDEALTRWRWVAGATAVLLLSFGFIGLYGVTERWLYSPPPGFDLLFSLPGVAAALSVAAAGAVLDSWYRGRWRLRARAHLTLVTAGTAVLCGLCWFWNLLAVPL
ncbi:serine hydrolase [Halobellus sp. GM3]|uniref:serine hydrolase n=1 Tax=Halobellus sp. GM3 TaxID=3458410 RepID=UPI00403DBB2D